MITDYWENYYTQALANDGDFDYDTLAAMPEYMAVLRSSIESGERSKYVDDTAFWILAEMEDWLDTQVLKGKLIRNNYKETI